MFPNFSSVWWYRWGFMLQLSGYLWGKAFFSFLYNNSGFLSWEMSVYIFEYSSVELPFSHWFIGNHYKFSILVFMKNFSPVCRLSFHLVIYSCTHFLNFSLIELINLFLKFSFLMFLEKFPLPPTHEGIFLNALLMFIILTFKFISLNL